MQPVPRILRALPRGAVTRPAEGIQVLALLRWHDGRDQEVDAVATAWTRGEVEITWEAPGIGLRTDWVPAAFVRRPGNPPRADRDLIPRTTSDRSWRGGPGR